MKKRMGCVLMLALLTVLSVCVCAQAQSRTATVKTSVTVYQNPSAKSKVLGSLQAGAEVKLLATKGKIAKIQYAGRSAYIKKSAVSLSKKNSASKATTETVSESDFQASSSTAVYKTTLRKTIAYKTPSTSCKTKTTVRKGTRFAVIGAQGSFYKVKRSGKVAYVPASAFTKSETTEKEKVSDKTQSKTIQSETNVYQEPNASAKIIGSVPAGGTLQVVKKGKSYVQVAYAGQKAYVPLKAFTAQEKDEKKVTPAPETNKQKNPHSGASAKIEKVIYSALQQLGKPYVYGSTGTSSFDCSGLTRYAFSTVGVSLPHSAYNVGYSSGKKVSSANLKRGDVVCFNTISDGDLSDHVGIHLGNNQFVHASSGKGQVIISELAGYYQKVLSWGRRILG